MGTDGLGKKLVFAAAAVGAILLVLRIVGGRGGQEVREDDIDRVDTGRSDDEGDGGPVETGLERVRTDDADDEAEAEAKGDGDEEDDETGSDEVAVEATRGRFDDLDLFDYVAIAGVAFEAAREEYRDRI